MVSHRLAALFLLSLLEFLQLVILSQSSLLIVILVGFKGDNGVPQVGSLVSQLIRVHGIKVEGLDTDAEGNLHFLLDLFLGLGHFPAGIKSRSLLFLASLLLLGSHHFLPLALSLLEPLLLLLGLLCPLFGLLLSGLLLFLSLLLSQFLLLFSSDFLSLGLFVLHSLELFLLLGSLFPPLVDEQLKEYINEW